MKLQNRYLSSQLVKSFIVCLGALLSLFFLIDYALGAKELSKESADFLGRYYLGKLSSFATILFPFAFLLASLIVLADLNNKRQWLALQACKITRGQLLKPFFIGAFLLAILLLANNQFLAPLSSSKPLKTNSYLNPSDEKVHALTLKGGGLLFFQSYDSHRETLHDIYWLPNKTTLWHIKTLHVDKTPVVAEHAQKLTRQERGPFTLTGAFKTLTLEELQFELPDDTEEFLDTAQQPLSLLFKKASLLPHNDQQAKATSYFLYKLLTPLLPLLLLFASAPSALQFSKNFSYFTLFGFWIILYIIVVALLDAAFFLGESHLLNPTLAITMPLLLVLSLGVLSWKRST